AAGGPGGALVGAGAARHAGAAAADLGGAAHGGADPVGAARGQRLALDDAAGVGAGLRAGGALVGAGRHALAAAADEAVAAGGRRRERAAAARRVDGAGAHAVAVADGRAVGAQVDAGDEA